MHRSHRALIQRIAARSAGVVLVLPLALGAYALPADAAVSSWQQKGISFYPGSPSDFGSDGFRANVDHFKSLGFNTITLIVQLYQSNTGSTDIGPGGNTPTDASLASAIQYAHADGMQVMLKIHLDTTDGQWRANINPGDRSGWFANYTAMLKHYGQLAATNNVESFCIGTELVDMSSAAINGSNTQAWVDMIGQVRQIYHGQLTYDANWGGTSAYDEVRGIQFWSSLDFIGISAYYTLGGDGSVPNLENDWSAWQSGELGPVESQWHKPIVFTEVGYRSVTGAHTRPYDSGMSGPYDPTEQANDFQALLEFWNQYPYMQGADLWYAVSDPNAGGPGNTDYLPQNKPVEQTLKNWFGGSGATSTPQGPPPAFSVSGSASPASPSPGQPVTFTVSATDTGGQAWGDIVDLELYDQSGNRISQKVYDSQNFTAGESQSYTLPWTVAAGTYTLKAGVFDGNWNLYTWNDAAVQVSVGQGSGTTTSSGGTTGTTTPPGNPPPASGNGVTDIWWPTDGSAISGVQPFKALLENASLSAYSMFWQVDGGQMNQMSDSTTDYPHKEALVDVSGWNWKGSGPYTITFVSKDGSGAVLSTKSASITVAH